jgi:DNA repair exonuclease SbcCD nuclease subunit|tara:strand:+ start:17271 stop:18179 length:909 start_codon:yes stop_codon:yes gene_type:complete
LDVLEKAGFCEIAKYEESEKEVILKPLKHETIHIYGYPGKKSGLEVPSIRKIKILEPYGNHFRILMLHTTLKEVAGNIPIDSIPINELPEADYYAMGHIHIDYELENNNKPVIYGGPTFPNNFKELEDLKSGCFYIIELGGFTKVTKKTIQLKETLPISIEVTNAVEANEKIISHLNTLNLEDKIILLRIHGTITKGKTSDINFHQIQSHTKQQGAFSFLKNTSKLEIAKPEIDIDLQEKEVEKVEELIIKKYESNNPSDYNQLIFQLMDILSQEKQEDEKSMIFEERLLSALGKTLGVELN